MQSKPITEKSNYKDQCPILWTLINDCKFFVFLLITANSLSTTHLLISRAREIVNRRATWTFVLLCN